MQFREFGIRLSFLPQMTANRHVKLHVKPEVSTIDPANGVTVSGFRIPALSTRRIETDIELAEGQSFVIAGLLDDRVVENLSHLPGLAAHSGLRSAVPQPLGDEGEDGTDGRGDAGDGRADGRCRRPVLRCRSRSCPPIAKEIRNDRTPAAANSDWEQRLTDAAVAARSIPNTRS